MHAHPLPRTTGGVIPELDLAMRLYIARRHAGLEQEELAQLIGKSGKTIGRYERGEARSISTVMAWALATGVSYEWLATGRTPDAPNSEGAVTLWYSPAPRSPRTVERLDSGALNKAQRPMPMAS